MLHKKLYLALLILIAAPLHVFAQGWSRTYAEFETEYHPVIARTLPLANGGTLALVSAAWNPAAGYMHQFSLMQLDASGVVEQIIPFDFPGDMHGYDLQEVPGGGYVIAYERNTGTNSLYCLLRLDAQYNMLWNKTIEESAIQGLVRKIGIINDGFVISRVEGNNGGIIKIDMEGNVIEWLNPQVSLTGIYNLQKLSSGSVVTLGFVHDTVIYPVLSRWSANAQWQTGKILNDGTIAFVRDISITSDDQLVLCGFHNQPSEAYLAMRDSNFNLIWERTFPDINILDRVVALLDGSGFWATGLHQGIDGYWEIIKLDLQGNILSRRPLKVTFPENLRALPDGGALMAGGHETSRGSHRFYPNVSRIDNEGNDYTSGISGAVWNDLNEDCVANADSAMYYWTVQAVDVTGFTWWATSDSSGYYQIPLAPGQYTVTIRRPYGGWVACQDTMAVTVTAGDTLAGMDFLMTFDPQPVDSVCGVLFHDLDGDCQQDPFEPIFSNWPVDILFYNRAQLQTIGKTTVTDANGHFCITDLSDIDNSFTGDVKPSHLDLPGDGLTCWVTCDDQLKFDFLLSNGAFIPIPMHCDTLPPCPVMDVSVATAGIRPCTNIAYSIAYSNQGSVTAGNTSVVVTVDPSLVVTGASIPWSTVNGNDYTFDIGSLPSEAGGYFLLNADVPCDDSIGTTYCVEVHGYPDTLCGQAGGQWDGSEIEVGVECEGDSVAFRIRNVGTGNMTQSQEYIVIEDNVLLMQSPGTFQLNAQQEVTLRFAATGAFYRLEAMQSPGFPGHNLPIAWVEGCGFGGNLSLGFVNQYSLPDEESWLDIFCLESTNSFDPNDKNGFPRGYSSAHYINANTDLEYVIRFQNTGTAPAVNVELRDTLALQQLNIATVRPGASSHPYEFDIAGDGVVIFRFPNIYLPDTSQGQDVSQGFVKFRVSQQPDLPSGTKVHNTAAIYFDNNAPVITNRTEHTIGKDFIVVGTSFPPDVQINAFPNPTNGKTRLILDGLPSQNNVRLMVWTSVGQPILEAEFTGLHYELDAGSWPNGVYLFTLQSDSVPIGHGKFIKQSP